MPSFKSLSSKMLGGIKRKGGGGGGGADATADNDSGRSGGSDSIDLQNGSPEAIASRSVKAFCESGGPGQQNGDEVTFLPSIVESAESSPAAAAECARLIRKFLKKEYWPNPSYQYNALMLARILSDNPGQTFTRNMDDKFVDTLKDLLRNGRDLSVRQMLMEMLDSFEHQKAWDEGLAGCIEMWKKEKEKAYRAYGGRAPPPQQMPTMGGQGGNGHSQNYFARAHNNMRLPNPVELANRLEEAKTSAGLLTQLVANTPSTEVIDNDLVKEFADRCLSASRSIQGYMTADNPGPDNETMESLIDVNEQLQQALNNQKRAILSARKELGIDGRSQNPSPQPPETNDHNRPPLPTGSGSFAGAPPAPRKNNGKGKGRQSQGPADLVPPPPGPPPGRQQPESGLTGLVSPISDDEDGERNPFKDPVAGGSSSAAGKSTAPGGKASASGGPPLMEQPNLEYEPFHPGFSKPTQSYLGRQDSAMGKIQMHGAGSGSPEHDDDEVSENYRHNNGGRAAPAAPRGAPPPPPPAAGGSSSSAARMQQEYRYDDGEDDIYNGPGGGSSSGKKPVYRY